MAVSYKRGTPVHVDLRGRYQVGPWSFRDFGVSLFCTSSGAEPDPLLVQIGVLQTLDHLKCRYVERVHLDGVGTGVPRAW